MWGLINTNGSLVAATHAGLLTFDLGGLLENDLASNLHDTTASAIRFNVNYRLTGSSAGDDITIACGIGWVSNAASAVGGTSIPDPSADHYDWMFHDIRTLTSTPGLTDQDEQVLGSHMVVKNDSMRKQRENGSSLLFVFRAVLLQATSCQVFIGGRTLFLNP